MKSEFIKILEKKKKEIFEYYKDLYPNDHKKADIYAKEDIDVSYIDITIEQMEKDYENQFDAQDRLFIIRTMVRNKNDDIQRKATDMMMSNESELWALGLQMLKSKK